MRFLDEVVEVAFPAAVEVAEEHQRLPLLTSAQWAKWMVRMLPR